MQTSGASITLVSLEPVIGRSRLLGTMRFHNRRDNSPSMSLVGLGLVLAGAIVALWWTAPVQVDLSLVQFPASFVMYRHVDRPAAPQMTQTAVPVPVSVAAVSVPVSVAVVLPPPTAVIIVRWRIAHTDGLGVVLRSAARLNAREPRGLAEGTFVTVLERQEPDWVRVRGEAGQEGWVPAQYVLAQP